ncbi:MAG: molybdopterin-synthase adenylyltransferase [Clostridiales bacterium]|jgi:adenylyltransferase/sulfurtransferase|nr:molybdopterin-synthase adenylyltransferase [Clostridiales bacterium]MDN5282422.1 molybdopterin-synthase adenylyltransferase [Candidatus Ozemobacter sp.]
MNEFARYEKQILFKPIGISGQRKLQKSRVGIIGSGATGSNLANILCRSGIGKIIIADQDRIELSNLQRQMLFNEKDIGHPKATRAMHRLSKINSEISVEGFFNKVTEENFSEIFADCDLIFDATDNFPTRFMLNRLCLKSGIPWVFTGVTASSGQSFLFVPGKTACLNCLIPEETQSDNFPTVHNSGIITSIVTIIASISAVSGIRFLVEKYFDSCLKYYDAWDHEFRKMRVEPSDSCSSCRDQKLRRK